MYVCMYVCFFFFQWEPVEYFNNNIICDLVDEKHQGIISVLVSELLIELSCIN